jgi:hypothetical protein
MKAEEKERKWNLLLLLKGRRLRGLPKAIEQRRGKPAAKIAGFGSRRVL